MVKMKNCVIWIQTVSDSIHKNKWIYKDIARDVEIRFDISKYELEKPLQKGKNVKVIG